MTTETKMAHSLKVGDVIAKGATRYEIIRTTHRSSYTNLRIINTATGIARNSTAWAATAVEIEVK